MKAAFLCFIAFLITVMGERAGQTASGEIKTDEVAKGCDSPFMARQVDCEGQFGTSMGCEWGPKGCRKKQGGR